ncbi:nucleolar protein dao-5 [Musca domestica]|uniref:Nuclear receptor corepressor 2 n=1 Tax=Musca domestica TaxID=7370 RepID=A0A1I8NAC6_MUSDO|nr:nucleolar protein dao-5 [Musca domestica]
MKFFNITLLFVILALACCLSTTMADDAKRGLRRPPGKLTKTSTTTVNPSEDEEGDYPENGEEGQEGEEAEEADVSTTTTTTEAPKRIGPVIRPFRSNDDFLNSLKRRQMNAKKAKAEKPAPKPKAPVSQDSEDGEEDAAPAAPAPAKGFSKPNSALSRNRKAGKPTKPEPVDEPADDAEAEPKEDAKPKRPLAGRLALRKRN